MVCNAQQFIDKLQELHKEGNFLFRGVPDARFHLEPGAFRKTEIKKYAQQFLPEVTIKGWFSKVVKNIEGNSNKALASTPRLFLFQLCRLLIQILQYNHAIYTRYNSDKDNFIKNCNDKRLINIFNFGDDSHWSKEKTFIDFFDRSCLSIIPLFSPDGKLIKKSSTDEDITGLDESYPQHYGMHTSALDWTYNPYKALFFTIYSDDSSDNSKYLSISTYKEIISEGSPIIIKGRDAFKDNPRALAQEGTFTYFRKPCSFYLEKDHFPSIESYRQSSEKFFTLEKLALQRTKKNIEFIQEVLKQHDISKQSLLLD